MEAVRRLFLLIGLLGFMGGAFQMPAGPADAPWERLDRHVRQTMGTGGLQPAVRVDLARGYASLLQATSLSR